MLRFAFHNLLSPTRVHGFSRESSHLCVILAALFPFSSLPLVTLVLPPFQCILCPVAILSSSSSSRGRTTTTTAIATRQQQQRKPRWSTFINIPTAGKKGPQRVRGVERTEGRTVPVYGAGILASWLGICCNPIQFSGLKLLPAWRSSFSSSFASFVVVVAISSRSLPSLSRALSSHLVRNAVRHALVSFIRLRFCFSRGSTLHSWVWSDAGELEERG